MNYLPKMLEFSDEAIFMELRYETRRVIDIDNLAQGGDFLVIYYFDTV